MVLKADINSNYPVFLKEDNAGNLFYLFLMNI